MELQRDFILYERASERIEKERIIQIPPDNIKNMAPLLLFYVDDEPILTVV